MKRRWFVILGAVALLTVVVLVGEKLPPFGARSQGERLERIESSPLFKKGKAQNLIETPMGMSKNVFGAVRRYMRGGQEPTVALPVNAPTFSTELDQAFTMTWMGHSSVLIEIEGVRVLTDPVFSKRASPFQWAGPARFHPTPVTVAELPPLDAVLISHDHYDHLDMETIAALQERGVPFVVPLGVGAHLEAWGVPLRQIRELEWWEETAVGNVRLVCTPARHFSGRGATDRNRSLWASWAIVGSTQRVWFSGDTGPFPQAAEIGERLGPFDLSMIEVGAYDPAWGTVHLGPDEALKMHKQVGGRLMFPVHWGTFNLAPHRWDQPLVRLVEQSPLLGVDLLVPVVGETVAIGEPMLSSFWQGRVDEWAVSGRSTLDE